MSIAGLSMRRIRARALPRVPMRRRRQLCPVQRLRCTCAIMGALAAPHGMDANKHTAEALPFGGFKESEVAAFLAPGWS